MGESENQQVDESVDPRAPGSLWVEWSVFLAMARKELTVIARYPVEFIASFGQIFLIVAILTLAGSMFFKGNPSSTSQSGGAVNTHAGIAVYGFILFMFLSDTLWNIGYGVRQEQLQGTLEQLYLTPASKFASLVARVVNTLVWNGLLTLAASALIAVMIGELPFENPILGLFLFLMSLAGTFGVGFAFAALSLSLRETAQTVANFLQFGLLILCANFYPFAALPPWLEAVSRWIPLAYCVDALRSTLMGYPPGFPELAPIGAEIAIVTLFGLVMPVLGFMLYRQAERQARKQGSLAMY